MAQVNREMKSNDTAHKDTPAEHGGTRRVGVVPTRGQAPGGAPETSIKAATLLNVSPSHCSVFTSVIIVTIRHHSHRCFRYQESRCTTTDSHRLLSHS